MTVNGSVRRVSTITTFESTFFFTLTKTFLSSVIDSPAFTVHIIGNILKLPHPRSVFSVFEEAGPAGRPATVQRYPWAREVLNHKGKAPGDIVRQCFE
jgi:hypothetical protein